MATSIVDYYHALFSSSNPVQTGSTIDSIPTIISDDMNAQIFVDYMAWEVGAAIKQMPPLFYLNYWQLVGNDIIQSILNFF